MKYDSCYGGGGQGVSFYQMQGNSWKNHRLTGFFLKVGFFLGD